MSTTMVSRASSNWSLSSEATFLSSLIIDARLDRSDSNFAAYAALGSRVVGGTVVVVDVDVVVVLVVVLVEVVVAALLELAEDAAVFVSSFFDPAPAAAP